MSLYVVLLFLVVFIEAVTEIVVKSKIFEPVRNFINTRNSRVFSPAKYLLSCGHCFSVWVSLLANGVVFYYYRGISETLPIVLLWFVLSIVCHRLANYLHMFIDKYIDKFYSKGSKGGV